MSFKAILVICAQALLIKSALCQLSGGNFGGFGSGIGGGLPIGSGIGLGGLGGGLGGCGCGCGPSTCSFPTSSASPIAPYGISVISENQFEGQLCVGGNLPYLGTVALEGVVPTNGNGAVSYSCGESSVGITSDSCSCSQPANQYPALGFGYGSSYGSGFY